MSSSIFLIREHIVPAQHIREYPNATAHTQNEILQLHIKQYTPRRAPPPSSGAVTFIGAHANGFPKELYEPLWDELYERARGKFEIRGIWIADVAHQGQSYVMNENVLSDDPSWFDHSRDLLHMVNIFRYDMPRPIVGIGHSFGGAQLVNLSTIHPRLFTALILLDPVIELGSTTGNNPSATGGDRFGIATASTHRRDRWRSREEAASAFAKSSFYQKWDKRVFETWVNHGLRELPTSLYPLKPHDVDSRKEVTLKTTKHQEVWTYLRPNFGGRDSSGRDVFSRQLTPDLHPGNPNNYPFYRIESSAVFYKLPSVRPPVLYILGGDSTVSSPELRRNKVRWTGVGIGGSGGISSNLVKDVILPGIGHLVPMEAPNGTAQESVNWLEEIISQWSDTESEWKRAQQNRPKEDHLRVNSAWLEHIGTVPGRKDRADSHKL